MTLNQTKDGPQLIARGARQTSSVEPMSAVFLEL